jgi:heme exporter protein A
MARLFLGQARLWVLDEPVNGIDQEGVREIETLLESHVSHGGMIVLTSHQPLCMDLPAVRTVRIDP